MKALRMRGAMAAVAVMTGLVAVLAIPRPASADLMQDFDTLGGNDVLLEKAQALNPEANIRIVQDRVVDRRWREEVTVEYASVLGGDAYLATQNLGLNYNVHITPRWSVGAKYNHSFNQLRQEGQFLLEDTKATGKAVIPQLDHSKQSYMAVLNWYPIYGKMNLYDLGVVHFDVYALGGYGQIELRSGWTGTYTTGGGVGLWFSQHLSTRLEMRYQNYDVSRYTGKRPMDITVASVQMGYLHDLF